MSKVSVPSLSEPGTRYEVTRHGDVFTLYVPTLRLSPEIGQALQARADCPASR